eukprot:m.262518 g.262518  ORF g.262518 m.262518 type:complete len:612 (-) comp45914_c0_seq1:80-1915(-)
MFNCTTMTTKLFMIAIIVQAFVLDVSSVAGTSIADVHVDLISQSHVAYVPTDYNYFINHGRASSSRSAAVIADKRIDCDPTHTVMVAMRDGVKLKTDVYLPFHINPEKKWPVALSRGPYGNPTPSSCAGKGYTNAGIAAVFQDTRGQHGSEGTFSVFLNDGEDGYDTMSWITKQTWYDGKGIVTQGGSALGISQLMVAPLAHPAHKGALVMVGSPDVYSQLVYPNGNLRFQDITLWVKGTAPTFATENLADIAAHFVDDSYWATGQTLHDAAHVNLAGYHITGWFDFMNPGSLAAYEAFQTQGGEGARGKQHAVIGVIGHGTGLPVYAPGVTPKKLIGCQAGELVYPPLACSLPSSHEMLGWMSHLIMPENPAIDIPPVHYFTLGDPTNTSAPGNVWRNASQWPPAQVKPRRLFFDSGGKLGDTSDTATTSFTADPKNPCPTIGGRNLINGSNGVGPYDQGPKVETREDVVVFSSGVITTAIEVTGRVSAQLNLSISTPDASIILRLTDVYPDGRSMLMMEGDVRLALLKDNTKINLITPGQPMIVDVDLGHISLVFNEGHRLRVSIATANSPKLWVNPNDGSTFVDAKPRETTVSIYHGSASFLDIDVMH